MEANGATIAMARPKKQAAVGRPKAEQPMRSLVSLKGTPEFEQWLDELVDHGHQGTRALALRNALRVFAESLGFKKPQPKR